MPLFLAELHAFTNAKAMLFIITARRKILENKSFWKTAMSADEDMHLARMRDPATSLTATTAPLVTTRSKPRFARRLPQPNPPMERKCWAPRAPQSVPSSTACPLPSTTINIAATPPAFLPARHIAPATTRFMRPGDANLNATSPIARNWPRLGS